MIVAGSLPLPATDRKLAGEKGNPKVPPSPPCNQGTRSGGFALPGMRHHPMQNLTSAADDMTATAIPIAAADLTKLQILNQTNISALGQANPMQQSVLKLLQLDSNSLPARTLPKVSYRRILLPVHRPHRPARTPALIASR